MLKKGNKKEKKRKRERKTNLARKRAKGEGIKKAAVADKAGVGDAFTRARLRPLIQEHDARTVDNVCLYPCYVHILLYLRYSYYVVVRRPPYLKTITTTTLLSFLIYAATSAALQSKLAQNPQKWLRRQPPFTETITTNPLPFNYRYAATITETITTTTI